MRKTIISSTLAIALLTSSCATIISGSKQNVRFDSNPATATIFIDEVEVTLLSLFPNILSKKAIA